MNRGFPMSCGNNTISAVKNTITNHPMWHNGCPIPWFLWALSEEKQPHSSKSGCPPSLKEDSKANCFIAGKTQPRQHYEPTAVYHQQRKFPWQWWHGYRRLADCFFTCAVFAAHHDLLRVKMRRDIKALLSGAFRNFCPCFSRAQIAELSTVSTR